MGEKFSASPVVMCSMKHIAGSREGQRQRAAYGYGKYV